MEAIVIEVKSQGDVKFWLNLAKSFLLQLITGRTYTESFLRTDAIPY